MWLGIDLGTSGVKAVVLDEEGLVLGRGITNSRSNYDVACAVARSEAFNNVRFTLSGRALPDAGIDIDEGKRAEFLAELARRHVDVFVVDEQDLARELGDA